MISFDPYSPLSTLGGSSAQTDNQAIAGNFETFLTLLTTQLKNQSPLDPLDTNQFTQQLVDFAGVEQAVKTNQNLEDLAKLSAASAITGAVSFIGKQVAASGESSQLTNGEASWAYSLDEPGSQATFTVKDANGNEMFAQTIANPYQDGIFTWNGQKTDGSIAPEGTYTISVAATNSAGTAIGSSTSFTGTVTQVDMEGGTPVLKIGDKDVKLEDVLKILQAPETTA